MKIWVRTQNKEVLAKCDSFCIDQDEETEQWKVVCGDYESEEGYIGGEYSSEEKALMVLDLIENYIFSKERGNVRKAFQFPLNEEV